MIKMKKKSQAQEGAIIAITLILLMIFSAIALRYAGSSYSRQQESIAADLKDLNEEVILRNYLRSPVNIDINSYVPEKPIILRDIRIAELILLAKDDEFAEKELRKHTEDILSPLFRSPYFWGIHLYEEDEEIFSIYQEGYGYTIEYDKDESYSQEIPNYPGDSPGYYTVKLIRWED